MAEKIKSKPGSIKKREANVSIGILLKSDSTPPHAEKASNNAQWILKPDADVFPVLIMTKEELNSVETWQTILRLTGIHKVTLARWQALTGIVPIETLMKASGINPHFKNQAEWKEMAKFSDRTEEFALTYDFPVNILRLFERLTEEQCLAWTDIFERRNFKKNIIREILVDFYDIPDDQKETALETAQEFERNWKARSGVFPQEEIRAIIRRVRYPSLMSFLTTLKEAQKQFPTKNGIQLKLPESFESDQIKIELSFKKPEDLDNQIQVLQSNEAKSSIKDITELLSR